MPKPRASAFSKALQEAQGITVAPEDRETVSQLHGNTSEKTVKPQNGNTVLSSETVAQQDRNTVSQYKKVTFYLTPAQIEKLEDLEHEHRKRTHRRVNRNEIVRHLIDQCTANDLVEL